MVTAPKASADELLTAPAGGRDRGTIVETTAAISAAATGCPSASTDHAPVSMSRQLAESTCGTRSGRSGARNGSTSSRRTSRVPARMRRRPCQPGASRPGSGGMDTSPTLDAPGAVCTSTRWPGARAAPRPGSTAIPSITGIPISTSSPALMDAAAATAGQSGRVGTGHRLTAVACLDGAPRPHRDRRMPDDPVCSRHVLPPRGVEQFARGQRPRSVPMPASLRRAGHVTDQQAVLAEFGRRQFRDGRSVTFARGKGGQRTPGKLVQRRPQQGAPRFRAVKSAFATLLTWVMRRIKSGQ